MTDITVSSFKVVGKNLPRSEELPHHIKINGFDIAENMQGRTLSLSDAFKLSAGKSYDMKVTIDGADNTLSVTVSRAKKKTVEIYKSAIADIIDDASMADAVKALDDNYKSMRSGNGSDFEKTDRVRRHHHNNIAGILQEKFDAAVPGLVEDFQEARRFADILRSLAHAHWELKQ